MAGPGSVASIDALRRREPGALEALFESHADRLFRLANGLLRDASAAEDVVQSAFLALLLNLDRFEGRSQIGTWLYRVAYNASLDRLRQRGADPETLGERDPADPPPLPHVLDTWRQRPDELLVGAETRTVLDTAIEELPPGLRAVFELRDVEGLSTEETAEALGLTRGNVKVRLHRARLALRERLSVTFGTGASRGQSS